MTEPSGHAVEAPVSEESRTRDAELLAANLRESLERLPGPAYYKVLEWIHRTLRPGNYVEIGIHKGVSLLQVQPGTRVIGIDPLGIEPLPEIADKLPPAAIYPLTSDDFFARHDLSELLGGPVGVAFIDGLHLFEQVLQDFVNLERHADGETLILLHDCLPLNELTSRRERTTDFYCGDVWKAALALRRERPDLEMITVRTAPTGLCLVRGLDPLNTEFAASLPEIVQHYMDLDFQYFLDHRDAMPEEIANDKERVQAWLTRRTAEPTSDRAAG